MRYAGNALRGIRSPANPDWDCAAARSFDEGVTLLVVRESLECLALLVGDDVGHILIQPGLVCSVNLNSEVPLGSDLLLVGALALERVNFLILAIGGLCLCRWVVRLLGRKPDRWRENQTATQCDEKKTIAFERHLP